MNHETHEKKVETDIGFILKVEGLTPVKSRKFEQTPTWIGTIEEDHIPSLNSSTRHLQQIKHQSGEGCGLLVIGEQLYLLVYVRIAAIENGVVDLVVNSASNLPIATYTNHIHFGNSCRPFNSQKNYRSLLPCFPLQYPVNHAHLV